MPKVPYLSPWDIVVFMCEKLVFQENSSTKRTCVRITVPNLLMDGTLLSGIKCDDLSWTQ